MDADPTKPIGVVSRRTRPLAALIVILLTSIVTGTALLMLPISAAPGDRLDVTDALFAAAAACTNTGLAVRDPATRFTAFGQIVVLAVMQVGAVTAITVGTLLFLRLMRLRGGTGCIGEIERTDERITVRRVVWAVLLLELIGFVALLAFQPSRSWSNAPFDALFGAVSAVTNTGYQIGADAKAASTSWGRHVVMTPLILISAAGGPVWLWLASRRAGATDAPHRRACAVTLSALLGLYALGTIALFAAISLTTDDAGLADSWLQSAWLAASRTTGFGSNEAVGLPVAGRLILMGLMFAGGGPGSPVGGLNLFTLALLCVVLFRAVSATSGHNVWWRCVATIVMVEAMMVMGAAWLLAVVEAAPLGHLLFESISAVSNNGLSMGVTPQLTTFGRLVLIAAMLGGRLVPLWVMARVVLAAQRQTA